MKLFEMKHIKKSFDGLEVLKDISLDVEEGEVLSIIGPSGSGKSTILRCATGLETPDSGEIIKNGDVGLVFQQFNLFANMTIKANIMLAPVKLGVMTKDEASKKADELLTRIGLLDKADAYPAQLSGGQKQRLMIARAIAQKPRLLMLDEATSALDNLTQKKVSEALDGLKCTRIVIAHRLSTIKQCDRILVLDKGKIIEDGKYEELLEKNGFFAELVKRQRLDAL